MIEVTQAVDSGFTPENIADAEWLWTMLPTFTKWGGLKTYEKAAAIHAIQRFRQAAIAAQIERDADICAHWAEKYAAASETATVAKKRVEARDFESMGMACRFREHDIRNQLRNQKG